MDYENSLDVSKNFFRFMLLIHHKHANFRDFGKCSDLPQSQTKVLFFLFHNGPCSVSTIGSCLEISKPNMTPIIDSLLQNGFVTRYSDSKDRRILIIEVTDKGTEFVNTLKVEIKKKFAEKLSCLSDEDLLKLNQNISEISEILNKLE